MRLPGFIRMALRRKQTRKFYSQWLRPGDLCFDIGANIGERSEAMIDLGARVIALEPHPKTCRELEERLGGRPRFQAIQCGIGAKAGTATLFDCVETNECATFSNEFIDVFASHSHLHFSPIEAVAIRTHASLVAEFGRPRLTKIDTEGFELEVIKGMDQPPEILAFEFNRPLLHQTIACLDALANLGPARCNFIRYTEMHLVLPNWLPLQQFRTEINTLLPEDLPTGEIIVDFTGA